jgi:hypothetical protein|tara:strand:+ start:1447 stop:1668 length:222 start_codon:yes stop_codon:yes gene_type:complete
MKTLKQRVKEYLEAQRPYYGDEEVKDSFVVLETQNEYLSNMWIFHKMLILRLIDDNKLYADIEAAYMDNNFKK